jgi:hypothetical protein
MEEVIARNEGVLVAAEAVVMRDQVKGQDKKKLAFLEN